MDIISKIVRQDGSALSWAVYKGHTDIVKILIGAGAGVDAEEADGTTCLMNAARYGRTEILKMLLDAGADVNKQREVCTESN